MNSVSWFWIILATLFLSLAVCTYLTSRPIAKNLKILRDEHPDFRHLGGGPPLPIYVYVYDAFRATYITNIIGFILAAIAATISSFSS